MPACCADAPCLHLYTVSYPGRADQVRYVRRDLEKLLADCPGADDIILCASELAANAARHSYSRRPGGTFTLHVEVSWGDHVRIAVEDNGGAWLEQAPARTAAGDSSSSPGLAAERGIAAPRDRADRTVWALFEWPDKPLNPGEDR